MIGRTADRTRLPCRTLIYLPLNPMELHHFQHYIPNNGSSTREIGAFHTSTTPKTRRPGQKVIHLGLPHEPRFFSAWPDTFSVSGCTHSWSFKEELGYRLQRCVKPQLEDAKCPTYTAGSNLLNFSRPCRPRKRHVLVEEFGTVL